MVKDNRKKPRRSINTTAYIYTIDGWPIGECKTLNISKNGMKLCWTFPDEVPPEFLLSLSRDGKVRRLCQLKWRNDDEIGVRFAPKAG